MQLIIISTGLLIEILLVGLFFWLDGKDVTWFGTLDGLFYATLIYIFLIELIFILANISTFIYWFCAKKKNGKGDFAKHCIALLLTTFCTLILITLFFNIIAFGELIDSILIPTLSCIGVIASLIFWIVRMSIQTAKIHKLNPDCGTNVFLFGTLLQSPLLYLAYLAITSQIRILFKFMIPFTMQVITIVGIVVIVAFVEKIIKKFRSERSIR
jgi:hypothetical protein